MLSKELHEKGQALLDAAYEYWKQAHKEGIYGAIIWLDDTDGRTVIFTRGEYRGQLLYNISGLRQEARQFTHNMNTGELVDDSKNLDYPESN